MFNKKSKEKTQLNADTVRVDQSSIVKIKISKSDIVQMSQDGTNLILVLRSGERLVVENFYANNHERLSSSLVIEEESGTLYWFDEVSKQYKQISRTDELLPSSSFLAENWEWIAIGTLLIGGLAATEGGEVERDEQLDPNVPEPIDPEPEVPVDPEPEPEVPEVSEPEPEVPVEPEPEPGQPEPATPTLRLARLNLVEQNEYTVPDQEAMSRFKTSQEFMRNSFEEQQVAVDTNHDVMPSAGNKDIIDAKQLIDFISSGLDSNTQVYKILNTADAISNLNNQMNLLLEGTEKESSLMDIDFIRTDTVSLAELLSESSNVDHIIMVESEGHQMIIQTDTEEVAQASHSLVLENQSDLMLQQLLSEQQQIIG
ncbi:BapA prefix-like domain-containing protein [Acinetobacter sp. ASP199]|uniref:BapA/Bap/LapF family prefix-like domain-containing protein n=1 Tax=unclassified Acinetobacter TaxID=196816 RepID=UPI001F60C73C|nr:BapA prefix-like domain-containing protein [Acinetobacter sp. ASP199]